MPFLCEFFSSVSRAFLASLAALQHWFRLQNTHMAHTTKLQCAHSYKGFHCVPLPLSRYYKNFLLLLGSPRFIFHSYVIHTMCRRWSCFRRSDAKKRRMCFSAEQNQASWIYYKHLSLFVSFFVSVAFNSINKTHTHDAAAANKELCWNAHRHRTMFEMTI